MNKTTNLAVIAVLCLNFCLFTKVQSQTITGNVTQQPCNNNGIISVTVAGLTPPISYTYSNWMANQNIVHAGINATNDQLTGIGAYQNSWGNPNIWNVSASDGVNTAAMSITVVPAFTDSINVIPGICPASSTLQAVNFVGGTPPYSCVWTNNNTLITYPSNPAFVPNGQYSLLVTDAAGCMVASATGSSNIYVASVSGISPTITGTSANCTNGTASVTAVGGNPPYSYLWNNNATTQSLSGLTQGALTCIVTDNLGCQSTAYYYVSQAVTINYTSTIGNATCLQNNGTINMFATGGTAPYTYMWSNSATTSNITNLSGGQYIAQITDANGCTRTAYAYVGSSTPINITYTATPSSCTSPTGSATITATGGTAPYTVIWYLFPSNGSGMSISGKPAGNYSFKVTDANGCIATGVVNVPSASALTASISNSSVFCPTTTGSLTAVASGSNPPFSYVWNNSSTSSTIGGVPLGVYTCTITDAVGCSVVKQGYLSQSSPINVALSSTAVTCLYASNGAVAANATGGTSPYVYTWSNSQTGSSISGLTLGNYYVNVTDANGCSKNAYVSVGNNASSNACYCTITGTVFADANNDCVRNSGENGIPNVQIHVSGFGYVYTNSNGVYFIQVPSGTYTVTETVQTIYPLATCQINNQVVSVVAAANCVSPVNFANNVVPISDLHIITSNMNFPIPGNSYNQKVIVQNDGTITESSIQLRYKHDGQLSYSSTNPWTLSQPNSALYPNLYSINSGFTTLNPGSSSFANFYYNVPTNIPLSTQVVFFDTAAKSAPVATTWLTDNTPWNNVNSLQTTVIGSYDPNYKEVIPQGVGTSGNITSKDSLLTYVVHFQNTGTYYAQNIVVIDSLDPNLNISTVRPGYSDHAYTVAMSESGVLKFTFKNINLPYQSVYGDELSSGMFTYSVKLKKGLALGTKIKNKAAIYFDFNEPIITNTTLNTLVSSSIPNSVRELGAVSNDGTLLFPNPANSFFTLIVNSTQNTTGQLSVFDVNGKLVLVKNIDLKAGENRMTENTELLQNGIYLVQFKTESTFVGKKLVISK